MQFMAQIQGGIGPDVWDWEVFIDGADFMDAASIAAVKANYFGGQVTLLEQCDCSEVEVMGEVKRLRKQLADVNHSVHSLASLASLLCGVGVVAEKDGYELLRRESVMDLVTRWRRQWDEAMKAPTS